MYDFDKIIDRKGTNSLKYDFAARRGMPDNLIPLWVADMDFPAPPEVLKALHETADHGVFGYSLPLRPYYQALHNWFLRDFGYNIKEDWVVLSPGVVFAVATAVKAFTETDDNILIQMPVYYPFRHMIRQNHRNVVNNPLKIRDGKYHIDFDDFEKKIIENNIKLFILCSPHNPVGRVWTREELTRMGEICIKYDCLILADEIHCDFTFPGHRHTVFASISEKFAENTITCTAPSKTFNLAGLQLSNILIRDEKLRNRFKTVMQATGFDEFNTFGLRACQSAYEKGADWLNALRAYLLGNLNYVRSFLAENLPKVKLIEPEGTYLLWLDFRELGMGAKELDDLIINKAQLWLDGGTMFGAEGVGFQRINIACPRAILEDAMTRLCKAF